MEELQKNHKERGFGWVLTMQEFMHALRARHAAPHPVDRRPEPPAPLDDLHNLAAPH
jgi:hypothetical protein